MNSKYMAEISEQSWDSFVLANEGSFLQSWAWADFQKSLGKKVLLLKDKNWQTLILVNPLPFVKSYFYAPYGPVWDRQENDGKTILADFWKKIKSAAIEHNAIFIKIEPKTSDIKVTDAITGLGFIKSRKSVQPEDTLVIDLAKDEKEIFESFEKRCRYEIDRAAQKNVAIHSDNSENGVKQFLSLLEKTAERDSFRAHPRIYYEKMAKTLKSAGKLDLFFARLGSDIISACIVVYSGKTASYIHAASGGSFRAGNALVWAAIKEAKKKQCLQFDLYGVAPKNAPENHPWRGLTRFKESFGGQRVRYIGAFDYPISKSWYNLYKIYKKYK